MALAQPRLARPFTGAPSFTASLRHGARRVRSIPAPGARRNVALGPRPAGARSEVTLAASAATTVAAPARQLVKVGSASYVEYNEAMKHSMGSPYEYHPEQGLYYTRITPHIILGAQPRGPADVTLLVEKEGVGAILNMQEDKDAAYWQVDLPLVQRRCEELRVAYHRRPAVDFDPGSLRWNLPRMVAVIEQCVAEGRTVYVHCTAGLGRSPAAVVAYLFWFAKPKMDLQKAYDFVTSLRPCGPKWEAIRAATYDLAKASPYQPALECLPSFAFADVADWERSLIQERVRSARA